MDALMDPLFESLCLQYCLAALTSLYSEIEMMAWESTLPFRHTSAKVKDTDVYWDRIDLLFERGC